jgi:LmbE family N-acetylglucosaminyl deacetylase
MGWPVLWPRAFEASLADLVAVRQKELETAVAILGVTLHTLGYRDSGYVNDPANEHPDAFIQADQDEVVGRSGTLDAPDSAAGGADP